LIRGRRIHSQQGVQCLAVLPGIDLLQALGQDLDLLDIHRHGLRAWFLLQPLQEIGRFLQGGVWRDLLETGDGPAPLAGTPGMGDI